MSFTAPATLQRCAMSLPDELLRRLGLVSVTPFAYGRRRLSGTPVDLNAVRTGIGTTTHSVERRQPVGSALRPGGPLAPIGPMAVPRDPIDLGAPICPMDPEGWRGEVGWSHTFTWLSDAPYRPRPIAVDVLSAHGPTRTEGWASIIGDSLSISGPAIVVPA